MKMRRYQVAIGAIAIGVSGMMTSGARADLVAGASIVVPEDNTTVSIKFLRREAVLQGDLYFMGSGTASAITRYATNSDTLGLGRSLFNNHTGTSGEVIELQGTFDSGDVLHFGYNVMEIGGQAVDTWRTDIGQTQQQFAYDSKSNVLGIEDLGLAGSDLDYNDIEVEIMFLSVATPTNLPAPGALAALALAGATAGRRRRR